MKVLDSERRRLLLIQECKKCSNKFTWKKIAKSTFGIWGYEPIKCDACNAMHYINITTRLLIGLSIVIPVFIPQIPGVVSTFRGYCILIYILWVILMIGLIPFFARYNIKNN